MPPVKDTPRRPYAGETGDQRAARRRDALIEAAFALVAEEGWRQLRIERISRRAGLNKRYFYESFDDLDAVIGAVMRQLADDVIDVTLAALDPSAADHEFVHGGISALVRHVTDDPRRARVLFGATPAGEAASAHRAAAIRKIVAAAAEQGRSYHAIADGPLVGIAAAMLVGGTSQAVLDWLDEPRNVPREEFIDELAALWQIISDGAAKRARRRTATA
jgi:AcrR family transcriptional regulator